MAAVLPEGPVFSGNKTITGTLTLDGGAVVLRSDAAHELTQRNGANAQTFRLYTTFTDAANYERLAIRGVAGGAFELATEQAGTGAARDLRLTIAPTAGASRLQINSTGTNVGLDLRESGAKKWTAASYNAGGTNRSFTFYNEQTANDGLLINGDTNLLTAQLLKIAQIGATPSNVFTMTPTNWTGLAAETIPATFQASTVTITASYATQRWVALNKPTITAGAAQAITTAATLWIEGAPVAAGSATITNPLAVWVAGGDVRIDSAVALGGGAAPTLGTIGGSGPGAAAQNEWLRIRTQNGVRFIPVWA